MGDQMHNEWIDLTKSERLLKFLREGAPASLHWLPELQDELTKTGQTLADIGTDEKELRQLEIQICRRIVRGNYTMLRDRHNHEYYENILEAVGIGGFALWEETGGSTDEELRQEVWTKKYA